VKKPTTRETGGDGHSADLHGVGANRRASPRLARLGRGRRDGALLVEIGHWHCSRRQPLKKSRPNFCEPKFQLRSSQVAAAHNSPSGGMRRGASLARSVGGPGRSHRTFGRWTSTPLHVALAGLHREGGSAAPLSDDLQERGSARTSKAVRDPRWHDGGVADRAPVDLGPHTKEHLAADDAQDLIACVVAMEISHLLRRYWLQLHHQPTQPGGRIGNDSYFPCLPHEGHPRTLEAASHFWRRDSPRLHRTKNPFRSRESRQSRQRPSDLLALDVQIPNSRVACVVTTPMRQPKRSRGRHLRPRGRVPGSQS
jgi:hypothetical protein